jgi:hypothetical protein
MEKLALFAVVVSFAIPPFMCGTSLAFAENLPDWWMGTACLSVPMAAVVATAGIIYLSKDAPPAG